MVEVFCAKAILKNHKIPLKTRLSFFSKVADLEKEPSS